MRCVTNGRAREDSGHPLEHPRPPSVPGAATPALRPPPGRDGPAHAPQPRRARAAPTCPRCWGQRGEPGAARIPGGIDPVPICALVFLWDCDGGRELSPEVRPGEGSLRQGLRGKVLGRGRARRLRSPGLCGAAAAPGASLMIP